MAGILMRNRAGLIAATLALLLPGAVIADTNYDVLAAQLENLKAQLEQVQAALTEARQDQSDTAEDIAVLKDEVTKAAEWKTPSSLIHMAGYADAGYTNGDNTDGSFKLGSFSPIFHFQYRDKVMLETELEFETTQDGETDIAMEYMTVDYFINDYMALVAGQFLSPVGQFRQNLHPSWINKLPKAPPGFGHDGAAPTSDLGLQLRGGFPLGGVRSNYAIYVGNGPELNAAFEDGVFELEGIQAEAFGADRDGKMVVGGRFAILPFSGLEVGLSGATGKATVTGLEDEATGEITSIVGEMARDYDVFGADFNFMWKDLGIRGEYIRSKIGATTGGLTSSEGAEWSAWYSQAAWRLPSTKFEAVLRFADFDAPQAIVDQQQWTIGLNYLITGSLIAKGAYEFNDGVSGSSAGDNMFLLQLAYGF